MKSKVAAECGAELVMEAITPSTHLLDNSDIIANSISSRLPSHALSLPSIIVQNTVADDVASSTEQVSISSLISTASENADSVPSVAPFQYTIVIL